MSRVKKRPVTFDAMVKFFMQHYNIPTKKDIEKLLARLDRIESLVKNASGGLGRSRSAGFRRIHGKVARGRSGVTSTDLVMDLIAQNKNGVGVSEIQKQTGFEQKKIRNIIFRLNKNGKIRRVRRGRYTAV